VTARPSGSEGPLGGAFIVSSGAAPYTAPVRGSPADVRARAAKLRRTWSGRVATWDDHASSTPGFAAIAEAVVRRAAVGPDEDVVDLGAGTGLLALRLAPSARSVLAVDLAEAMLEVLEARAAAEGLGNVATLAEDLAVVDLGPLSVDVVVSSYALHHLTDADKTALVARAARWLRPGGRLVVADMMIGRGLSRRDREIARAKAAALIRKGPGGLWRIAKNVVRFGLRRGAELPAPPEFWVTALEQAGLAEVAFEPVVAEAGLVSGTKPS
jgi:ubiquinone/menaquinone biosynthesis C-methylase UbiE